ncbi:MAG: DUF4440 domain-containing protein [Rhizobiales bacterium]|nr:DUF4440 domain-containing protein [Hyphomicrobiales bacterium]
MQADADGEDTRAIHALIARQFASLNWSPEASADWDAFAADFHREATLYPAARPAKAQTVEAFVERMKGLETKLRSFHETVLGTEVHVFGNVAVAIAGCEIVENTSHVNRGVEMMLLVKDEGAWKIVSQAWDTESPSQPIPAHLAAS